MIGTLWILLITIVVGIIVWAADKLYFSKKMESNTDENVNEPPVSSHHNPDVCCGTHLVCEKESLSPASVDFEYYDDEELDIFKGRDPDSYSPDEIEQFRDVLMTLLPHDLPGWAKSIQLRQINLPTEIRDELLLLITELRQNKSQ